MEGIKYEDPNRLGLIESLKKEGKKQPLWARLADDLGKSRKNRAEINLEKINSLTKPKDTVVIAGKVLGSGSLDHAVTIACFKISESAKKKVEGAKGSILTIDELLAKNPKGSKVLILR
jgi:large subunit ribosomal protein L18e